MSTPTPCTDAVYLEHRYWANEDEATEAIEDLRDLARKLERELAIERATLAGVIEIKRGVEAELAEMKRRLSSEKLMYKLANDSAIKHEWAAGELRNELAAERAKVKALREACESIEEQWDKNHSANPFHAGNAMQSQAMRALAATEDAQ